VQLHADPDELAVEAARASFSGAVWAAVRLRRGRLPQTAVGLFRAADAVVLDAHSSAALGGTGQPLPWRKLTTSVARVRGLARVVLAGGLRAENVAEAVRELHPDIVDVSSGVESAPGVKDHAKLRAFADAVQRGIRAP
jgi:phosphoribosylanthranilate isomerase